MKISYFAMDEMATAPNAGVLATDPPVSEKQRRAMYAARAGHSTLGIPKSVGEEFVGKDMKDEDWDGLVRGLLKFLAEESDEPEHAEDSLASEEGAKAFRNGKPKSDNPHAKGLGSRDAWNAGWENAEARKKRGMDSFAMDRASIRSTDADGRLHVTITPISKANVCPYRGSEIPDGDKLNLNPDSVYYLLRDPEELKKAAATFNNLPLLSEHVAVDAMNHRPELVVGSTGTDATFDGEYLQNSLVVWAKELIDAIEADEQKELSSAYRYRADMTPGNYKGTPYDGVMRDIVGNHVALVKEGRAGPDVVVGDSALQQGEVGMSKVKLSPKGIYGAGALAVYLMPKLALDAKVDLAPIFDGVTQANFKDKKADIVKNLEAAVKGKLAKDASMNDVHSLLDKIEKHDEPAADEEPNEEQKKAQDRKKARDKFLMDKGMTAEDVAAYDAYCAEDEFGEEDDDKKKGKDKKAKDKKAKDAAEEEEKKEKAENKKGEDEEKVSKSAMDAAIKAATTAATANAIKLANSIATARETVHPWVGKLAMDAKGPDDVFKAALDLLKVDVTGVHPSAYETILKLQPQPGAKKIASDEKLDFEVAGGFSERWSKQTDRIAVS